MAKNKDETGYHALPKEISKHLLTQDGAAVTPNLSLKYYKWSNIYKDKVDKNDKRKVTRFGDRITDKGVFLQPFVALSKDKKYQSAFAARKTYFEKMEGSAFSMQTASRLVFGMGYDHPTEIGFMFDWTTGLPIIPGSSLKGAARAAARDAGWSPKEMTEIFGKEMIDGEKESQSGRIVFMPAYPVVDEEKAFLELDVMTPHYAKYYEEPRINPPADYYSPRPLKFLTVPVGIKYRFQLLDRDNPEKESDVLNKAAAILKHALKDAGVGAKTNVFYGYFKDPA